MSKMTKNKTTSGVWKANKMFSKLRIYMQFVKWNVYQLSTNTKKIYLHDSSIQRFKHDD
jgi:hypothetical protein